MLYKIMWGFINLIKRIWRFFKRMAGYEIKEDPNNGQGDSDNPGPRADLTIELDTDLSCI